MDVHRFTAPVPCGSFELTHMLGKGGMGSVWAGRHRSTGVDVAIKVLKRKYADKPRVLSGFRDEARSTAGLHHPNIVSVFDYGLLDKASDELSQGTLQAGSPFIAMEYVSGGTLSRVALDLHWPDIKGVMLTLLDALAHAHARRVVHLDLKPPNILIDTSQADAQTVKLVDFGVAHALERQRPDTDHIAGTPNYMSPEQIEGRWRDMGPWTDLYALGCVAYRLLYWHPPFYSKDLSKVLAGHLHAEPTFGETKVEVPAKFIDWTRRMLAKSPKDRYRRAADAAWELHGIEVAYDAWNDPTVVTHRAQSLLSGAVPVLTLGPLLNDAAPAEPEEWDKATLRMADRWPIPPLPDTWRRPDQSDSMAAVGAGLGLFDLRQIPLVGRETERDELWNALIRVRRTGSGEVVVLTGPTGTGKTRLANWIAERAHEVGATSVLRASHSAEEDPEDGIAPMIARFLGCAGLTGAPLAKRVNALMADFGVKEGYEVSALIELLGPAPEHASTEMRSRRLSGLKTRHTLMLGLLEHFCQERPAVFILDDVHFSLDALSFAETMLRARNQIDAPVLVILTVQTDELANKPAAKYLLEQVIELRGGRELPLAALPKATHSKLVRTLLRLDGRLAADVERLTEGNPLFAVQLVGDWIERGILKAGESGFELVGDMPPMPSELLAVWQARLDKLLDDMSDTTALKVAAVLGAVVDDDEWLAACRAAGVTRRMSLVDRLCSSGLARKREGGWAFAHAMLRESLLDDVRAEGHWVALNTACAAALASGGRARRHEERMARYLLEAGEHARAIEPLFDGVEARIVADQYGAARSLVDLLLQSLDKAGVPLEHIRWGRARMLSATVNRRRGRPAEALQVAHSVEMEARRQGWRLLQADARRMQGVLYREQGDTDRAVDLLENALATYDTAGDDTGTAECCHELGIALARHGEPELAMALQERALELHSQAGNLLEAADAVAQIGDLLESAGDPTGAREAWDNALEAYADVDHLDGAAYVHNSIGEMHRGQSENSKAEKAYRQSAMLYGRIGSPKRLYPESNLAALKIAAKRYPVARKLLTGHVTQLQKLVWKGQLLHVHAMFMAIAAGQRDKSEWDSHCQAIGPLLEVCDAETAAMLQSAGEIAAGTRQMEQARSAWQAAEQAWRRLGFDDLADQVASNLARLPPA